MFGGGGNFGGTGYGGGGFGGGGFGGAGIDNDPGRPGGAEAGGFNAVPGGGFGGGFGGAPPAQSQGLGGYLNQPTQGGGSPDGQQKNQGGQRDQQSMMPITIRMLLDAHERSKQAAQTGPDAPLYVNNRELTMFTFVACLEHREMEQIYKVLKVSDGTGRITVKQYHDAAQADSQQELQVGSYVRIFGTFRFWGGDFHVSAHHIGKVENPNEVSFHFIEVAHTHLALNGRLPSKQAPAPNAAPAQSSSSSMAPPAFGAAQHIAQPAPSFGGQPPLSNAPGGLAAGFGNSGPWGGAPPGGAAGTAANQYGQRPGGMAQPNGGVPGGFGEPMRGFGGASGPGVQQPF